MLFRSVDRRFKNVLTTKIYPVGDTLTVFLADDKDSITFTGNGQVARHADGGKLGVGIGILNKYDI